MLAKLPWPVRSTMAGTAGTAVMTLAYKLEHRLRPRVHKPVDYDDSVVPGEIVANILRLHHVTGHEEMELGLALRWTYGSAFGIYHGLLRRRMGEPWPALIFFMTLMSATVSMFPLLGRTPPAWRWPTDVKATAVATHVAYAATVAAVDDRLRSSQA